MENRAAGLSPRPLGKLENPTPPTESLSAECTERYITAFPQSPPGPWALGWVMNYGAWASIGIACVLQSPGALAGSTHWAWPRFQSNGQSVRSPPLCPNCCGNLHGSQCRGPSSPFRLTEESESQLHAGYLAPSLMVAGQGVGTLLRGGHRELRTASSSWDWELPEITRLGAR